MTETKKATVEDILTAKKLIDSKKIKSFYSKTLNLEFEIVEIDAEKIAEIINSVKDENPIRSDCELIYECCPIFRNKELQEQLNVSDPVETVKKVFCNDVQEIDELAKAIVQNYGFTTDKVETVKKQ